MSASIIGARRSHLCRDKLTERAQLATKIYLKFAFKSLELTNLFFFSGSVPVVSRFPAKVYKLLKYRSTYALESVFIINFSFRRYTQTFLQDISRMEKEVLNCLFTSIVK